MAGGSLLMLLDDIAAVIDDVAAMTKMATKKTAGVLGDDLALNAEQVTGVNSNRELPVIWAVFKGSLINKLILVPVALLISFFANWLIVPLLMIGGAYLCFEGFEKVYHKFFHKEKVEAHRQAHKEAIKDNSVDIVALEKDKIKGAVRTDFILSAEIIAITLGVIGTASIMNQIIVLSFFAFAVTVFVYGLVAAIVRMDDVGFWLMRKKSQISKSMGQGMIAITPYLMKFLSIFGTAAMFLVGGSIIAHGIGPVNTFIQGLVAQSTSLGWLIQMGLDGVVGVITGGIAVAVVTVVAKMFKKEPPVIA